MMKFLFGLYTKSPTKLRDEEKGRKQERIREKRDRLSWRITLNTYIPRLKRTAAALNFLFWQGLSVPQSPHRFPPFMAKRNKVCLISCFDSPLAQPGMENGF